MRTVAVLVMSAVVAAAAGPARADAKVVLPAGLPPLGPPVAPVAPQVVEEKLDNGLTIWMVARPGFPKVVVRLAFRTGLAADPRGRVGLARLLASTLDKGARGWSAARIAEELALAGGELRANVTAAHTELGADVLAEGLPPALEALAAIATSATFPDADVAVARRVERERLRQAEAEPQTVGRRVAWRLLLGDHPLAAAPTDAALAAVTPMNLRSAFRTRIRPDESLLVIVGAFDVEATRVRARALFGGWRRGIGAVRPLPPVRPVPPRTGRAIALVARPGSVQTSLTWVAPGVREGEPDHAAWEIAAALLGAGWSSRLMSNLVEDKGYATSAFAYTIQWGSTRYGQGEASPRNEVAAAALNEILYELGRLATTEPSAEELQLHRDAILGRLTMEWTDRAVLADKLVDLWLCGVAPAALRGYPARLAAVTAAELGAAARKYWSLAAIRMVAVGDEEVIRKALAPLGIEPEPAF